MQVALPTQRQVISGLIAKLDANRNRTIGEFTFTLGNRQVKAPIYITSGVRQRLGGVKVGRRNLYGEFRKGTFIVLGPDTRRAAPAREAQGVTAPVIVSGELYRMEHRVSSRGSFYITGIFRYRDGAGGWNTSTLLVRGGTANALRDHVADGPITVEGFTDGDNFEVTGVPGRDSRTGEPTRTVSDRAEPAFRQMLNGFWRPLKPHQIGKDAHKNPIQGKTWVKAHERYKHRPQRPVETAATL